MEFSQTHVVGVHGAPTWAAADPGAQPGPRLDPGLPVQALEATGDWTRVRCANGWETWTDGRWITVAPAGGYNPTAAPTRAPAPAPQPAPQAAYPPQPPAYPQQPQAYPQQPQAQPQYQQPAAYRPAQPAYQQPVAYPPQAFPAQPRPADQTDTTMLAIGGGGAGLAALGSFLPWYTAGGFSIDGFDMSFWGLLADKPTEAEPTAGLVMLLGAIGLGVLIALARSTPLPSWSYGIAGLVIAAPALLGLLRWMTAEGEKPSLGIGLILGLLGGAGAVVFGVMKLMQPARPGGG